MHNKKLYPFRQGYNSKLNCPVKMYWYDYIASSITSVDSSITIGVEDIRYDEACENAMKEITNDRK